MHTALRTIAKCERGRVWQLDARAWYRWPQLPNNINLDPADQQPRILPLPTQTPRCALASYRPSPLTQLLAPPRLSSRTCYHPLLESSRPAAMDTPTASISVFSCDMPTGD